MSMKLTPSSTPDPGAGEAHGAEAEAVDGEVAAEGEGARGLRRSRRIRSHGSQRTRRTDTVIG